MAGPASPDTADGNLTSDGLRNYTWVAENRLVGITYPGQPGKSTAFSYDGLSRRTAITSTPAGGGAVTTSYLWCGARICQARNASDAITREYFAEGEYVPGAPGQPYYYGPDQIGSVRRVFASASSAPAFSYDPYGNALQGTAPLTDFNYAGMFYNADSGLYLTQYRAYDPVSGRWLSRDPIGEMGQLSPSKMPSLVYRSTSLTAPFLRYPSAIRAADAYHPNDITSGIDLSTEIHNGKLESFSLIMIELQEEINLYFYTANNPISYRDTQGLDLADDILDWLGPGAACFRTPAGATMLMSADRQRIIRFDLEGHGIGPHINIEPGRIHVPLRP